MVVATGNIGKRREIEMLLSEIGQAVLDTSAMCLESPEETAPDFTGNALIKAKSACQATGHVALADDSGLCVDALEQRPGIRTARWAQRAGGWAPARTALFKKLEAQGHWSSTTAATLHSALAIAWPDGHSEVFAGQVSGRLVWPERGDYKFGYDSMFVPTGHHQTFAEMPRTMKSRVDARAMAFERLKASLVMPADVIN